MHAVILCGGSGARLWPLSRAHYPKQFLALNGAYSLLQDTLLRLPATASVTLICNHEHRFIAAEQLRAIGRAECRIILEPEGRNTAPAIALAALAQVADQRSDEVMLVLPADHAIGDIGAFQERVLEGVSLAKDGRIVTLGITPTRPESGYGYIQTGEHCSETVSGCYAIEDFIEKPLRETAETYLHSGKYLWNSGIYMATAECYLRELARFQPEILRVCEQSWSFAEPDLDFIRISEKGFAGCPSLSVDHAIMEPLCAGPDNTACVLSLEVGWNDLGGWSALWEQHDKTAADNMLQGDVIAESVSGSLIIAQDRLVAAVGVDDLIIVDTADALLVADRSRSQEVKEVVAKLLSAGREQYLQHREVYRPWGRFDLIAKGEGFLVKMITVKPGGRLSLQRHSHRAEHWVVVKGSAEIRCGNQQLTLCENESTFIPLGEIHALHNPGDEELVMIEVQSGSCLDEADIERYEDLYGRT